MLAAIRASDSPIDAKRWNEMNAHEGGSGFEGEYHVADVAAVAG